jgi:hypothetical protein
VAVGGATTGQAIARAPANFGPVPSGSPARAMRPTPRSSKFATSLNRTWKFEPTPGFLVSGSILIEQGLSLKLGIQEPFNHQGTETPRTTRLVRGATRRNPARAGSDFSSA